VPLPVASDLFQLFDSVTEHFGDAQMVLNCVVYGGEVSGGSLSPLNSAFPWRTLPTRPLRALTHLFASPHNWQAAHGVYSTLVQRTGGMLMQPCSRTAATLAKGLMAVVRALLSQLPGAPGLSGAPGSSSDGAAAGDDDTRSSFLEQLEGYTLYDVSGLSPRATEKVRKLLRSQVRAIYPQALPRSRT